MSFSPDEVERYARHLVLAEVGGPGQQALSRARVLIVGAGGVGAITLIDHDAVALSNLQRQVLFATSDLGRSKVEAGAERLTALNPHVRVQALEQRITADNARDLVAAHDLVIDGTDDFATRLTVNAACVAAGRPLVSGALGRWDGQVGVFAGRPCYRCLVSEIPPDAETCARVGVVGALAGVIGSIAALEAIKLITGAGQPLTGRLMIFDGLKGSARTVAVGADPGCPVCSAQAKARENSAT